MKQLLYGVAAVNAGVMSWSTAAPLAASLLTTAITPSIRHSGGRSGDPSQSNGVNRMRFDQLKSASLRCLNSVHEKTECRCTVSHAVVLL